MDKNFLRQTIKLLIYFFLFYGISRVTIAVSAPQGSIYNSFISHHLDYIQWLRQSILWAVGFILKIFSVDTSTFSDAVIKITGKKGVHITMSCIGYGVYSFWLAFVISNRGSIFKKIKWIASGLLSLWVINVTRITVFLVVLNQNRSMPLGINHHTWFNILAYMMILWMIYSYDRIRQREGEIPKS